MNAPSEKTPLTVDLTDMWALSELEDAALTEAEEQVIEDRVVQHPQPQLISPAGPALLLAVVFARRRSFDRARRLLAFAKPFAQPFEWLSTQRTLERIADNSDAAATIQELSAVARTLSERRVVRALELESQGIPAREAWARADSEMAGSDEHE